MFSALVLEPFPQSETHLTRRWAIWSLAESKKNRHDTTWTISHGHNESDIPDDGHISIYIGMVQPKGRTLRASHFQYKASLNSCPPRLHVFGTFQFTRYFLIFLDQQFTWVWSTTNQVYIICFTRDALYPGMHTLSPGPLRCGLMKVPLYSWHFLPPNTLLPIKINTLSISSTHFHPPTWFNKHVPHFIQKNGTYTANKPSNQIQHDLTTRSLKIKDNSYKRSCLNMQNSIYTKIFGNKISLACKQP